MNLDRERMILIALAIYPVVVTLAAPAFGVAYNMNIGADQNLNGYWLTHWPWVFPPLLPLSYYLYRRYKQRVEDCISDDGCIGKAIIYRNDATIYREAMRRRFAGQSHLIVAFLLAVALNVLDYLSVLQMQLQQWTAADIAAHRVIEADWTIYSQFTETNVSLRANSIFNLAAYLQQFTASWMGLALFSLSIQLNIAFLKTLWLRSRSGKMNFFMELKLTDADGKFGYAELGGIFNIQIALLALAGLICLISRIANTAGDSILAMFNKDSSYLIDMIQFFLLPAETFPDVGQIILLLVWVTLFVGLMLPAFVKFLPLLSGWSALKSARGYLEELFTPEELRKAGRNHQGQAEKFRAQAFWPGGVGQGAFVVMLAFFIFFWMVIPIRPTTSASIDVFLRYVVFPGICGGVSALFSLCLLIWFVENSLVRCFKFGESPK